MQLVYIITNLANDYYYRGEQVIEYFYNALNDIECYRNEVPRNQISISYTLLASTAIGSISLSRISYLVVEHAVVAEFQSHL